MTGANSLYTLLKEVFLILDEGDQYLFGQHGLSVTRFYTLYHLERKPGSTLRELSDMLLCDKSNVTRIVKSLEKRGLVVREPHERDGRSNRLFLTPEGSALQAKVLVEHQAFNRVRFAKQAEKLQDEAFLMKLNSVKDGLAQEMSQMVIEP